MSELIMTPLSSEIKIEWVELDGRIYTGPKNGYTDCIHLDSKQPTRPGSVFCERYWNEEGHWGFVFEGGHICLIKDNSIRYVKGMLTTAVYGETESDDVVHVEDGPQQSVDDSVHEPIVAPKRRGRPPKVRE